MNIVSSYNGSSNLDETLDDNISYLVGKYFYANQIEFKILKLDFVKAVPACNDELIRYEIEFDLMQDQFEPTFIVMELKKEGFEKGLTIKYYNHILYADGYSADIQQRRKR